MILSKPDLVKLVKSGQIIIHSRKDTDELLKLVNPASIDITLGKKILLAKQTKDNNSGIIDAIDGVPPDRIYEYYIEFDLESRKSFVIQPGNFILTHSDEYLVVPNDYVVTFSLKSTIARLGINHHLAGFIDPGFKGSLTLELHNNGAHPIRIYHNQRIGQLEVKQITTPLISTDSYTGKYQSDSTVNVAKAIRTEEIPESYYEFKKRG